MEQLDIRKLNVTELKSLAYDEMARLEICQANLRALNQEIAKRAQQGQQTPQENVQQGSFDLE